MKLYIYPQNLKATANLWLWSLRDFALICVGLLLSLVALTQMGILLPLSLTAAFRFPLHPHGGFDRAWTTSGSPPSSPSPPSRNTAGRSTERRKS